MGKPECPRCYWLLADEGCRCRYINCPACQYDYDAQQWVPCEKHVNTGPTH